VLEKFRVASDDKAIPTANKMGYMVSQADRCIEQFITFCTQAKKPVLDIGAAFGIATHRALEAGAQVTAVDLSTYHLDCLVNATPIPCRSRLQTIQGHLPDSLDFPENSFDAILVSRVLHFLSPDQIKRSIDLLEKWLNCGGRLFISVATPFCQLYEEFIPVFLERKKQGILWAGIIEDTQQLKHHRIKNFPAYLNLFDQDIVEHLFLERSLSIKACHYLSREDIPEDMRWDGREGVYIIVEKE